MEVTIWIGLGTAILTAVAAFYAARSGAHQAGSDRHQRERAAQREEWFRRLQWATELTSQPDDIIQAAGYSILDVLDASDLADADDRAILRALNKNEALEALQEVYSTELDETEFVTDDRDDTGGTP